MALLALPAFNVILSSEAFAQTTSAKDEALFLAIEDNNLTAVKEAITSGARIDAKDFNGMQPIDLAIERDYFEIAHYLISLRNAKQDNAKAPAQEKDLTTVEDTPAPTLDEPSSLSNEEPFAEPTADVLAVEPTAPEPVVEDRAQNSEAPDPFAQDAPPAPELPAEDVAQISEPEPQSEPKPEPIAEVKTKAPERSNVNAQTQTFNEVKRINPEKTSASNRFLSTFMDFFKPANTTGIMRKQAPKTQTTPAPLTADQLNEQLQELEAELGPALQKTGPALTPNQQAAAIRNDRIAKARANKKVSTLTPSPQAQITTPQTTTSNTPPPARKAKKAVFDESKPFNGQVDPEILAYLDKGSDTETGLFDGATENDPFALDGGRAAPTDKAEADPFAMTDTPLAKAEADPFATIDDPQDVAVLKTKKPPSRKTEGADPFAEADTASEDPFAEVSADKAAAGDPFAEAAAGDPFAEASGDVLDGLLDTTDSSSQPASGWDVKKVEGATLPNEIQVLAEIEPTGNILEGVELTLGADTIIGQEVGEKRLKLMEEKTIHKPCLNKGVKETIFCVDKVSWPFELEEDFLVDTIMYQGTSTVARYDAGRATNFHALFKSIAFPRVINYYINRFGQPSEIVQRAVAPLAKPRMDNPTYIWRSREAGTDTTTSLEIRKFDDERGSFPDIRRGVIMLYRNHAGPIFPQLSQLELMVLKANGQSDTFEGGSFTEESVW